MSNNTFEKRIALEKYSIKTIGYAVRAFQEKNDVQASWGYTLGLRCWGSNEQSLTNDHPVCIFVRGPFESDLIDQILTLASEKIIKEKKVSNQVFTLDNFTNTKLGTPVRFHFAPISMSVVKKLAELFNNYIEGQTVGTTYYWLQTSNDNDLFPGEKGYVDFLQVFDKQNTSTEPAPSDWFEEN